MSLASSSYNQYTYNSYYSLPMISSMKIIDKTLTCVTIEKINTHMKKSIISKAILLLIAISIGQTTIAQNKEKKENESCI